MDKKFKGLIWTKHALTRMSSRGIKQGDAWAVWIRPDRSRFSKNKKAWVYSRKINDLEIEVAAKMNEKKEWIILSVWSRKIDGNFRSKRSLLNMIKKYFFLR